MWKGWIDGSLHTIPVQVDADFNIGVSSEYITNWLIFRLDLVHEYVYCLSVTE